MSSLCRQNEDFYYSVCNKYKNTHRHTQDQWGEGSTTHIAFLTNAYLLEHHWLPALIVLLKMDEDVTFSGF